MFCECCALRERILVLDPSSVTIASEYVILLKVSSASPLIVISSVAPSVLLLTMNWVIFALISIPCVFDILARCFTKVFSSVFVPAKPSTSSVNRRLVMDLLSN